MKRIRALSKRRRTLAELVHLSRDLTMTEHDMQVQRMSFAHGQLAFSHKPKKGVFAQIARDAEWTEEQFEAWARDREWWP